MPAASRRCGVITKREAERLVKLFVGDSPPPRLPADFVFSVRHSCGWGCGGSFLPGRYNSSRAKCIKCDRCEEFFSPNKFVFHFHRSPDSTYRHPDAANFNSWRRHLMLDGEGPPDDLMHAWEDVKATFNSGKRKRHARADSSSSSNGCSAPQQQRYSDISSDVHPAFTQFNTYPINSTRMPFAAAPLLSVLSPPKTTPPAFSPSEPDNLWMNPGQNPFSLLFARHIYGPMLPPHAFGVPLLALRGSGVYDTPATALRSTRPTLTHSSDQVEHVSQHSAFKPVRSQTRNDEDDVDEAAKRIKQS